MANNVTTVIVDGKCSHCGADVEDADKYCHECGKRLHASSKREKQGADELRRIEMCKRFAEGANKREIAEEFGVSYGSVGYAIEKACRKCRADLRRVGLPENFREIAGRR